MLTARAANVMTTPGALLCGIDIGSEAVHAVLARVPGSSCEADGTPLLEVLAVGTAESRNSVQYGDIVRPGAVTEAARQAVKEVEQTAGMKVGSAFISVGSRTRRSINSSGAITILTPEHRITGSDVYRAVMAAVPRDGETAWLRPPYELLHALPQEFWVDDLDSTDDPIGWTGQKIESHIHLVSCPRATLERVKEAVSGADIRIERLVAAPLASGYGVLTEEERQEGVVLLDIGAMTTEIAVFRNGALRHSDLMPSGGRAYTRDLMHVLKTSHAHAEQVKRRYGVAPLEKIRADDYFAVQVSGEGYLLRSGRGLLADVLQRRAESELTKIRGQLGSVLREIPRTMVFTGGGANLDGLRDVARLVFGAEVERRGPRALIGHPNVAAGPALATAIGLCRYGALWRRGKSPFRDVAS